MSDDDRAEKEWDEWEKLKQKYGKWGAAAIVLRGIPITPETRDQYLAEQPEPQEPESELWTRTVPWEPGSQRGQQE